MAKKSMQLFSAAIILSLVLIATTAFINKGEDLSNGGGIANGHLFNYSAEENGGKVSGYFAWDGQNFKITCVVRNKNTALILLNNGMVVEVKDENDGDRITPPFEASSECSTLSTNTGNKLIEVDGGNLTVY